MESPEFDAIRVAEEINFNQSGQHLDYKQYVGALIGTAKRVDKYKIVRATRPCCSPQNVYLHDIDEEGDVFLDAEEIFSDYEDSNVYNYDNKYDINTTVFAILKASSNPKARLPPQAWYGLSPARKGTWDDLSEKDKMALIGNLTGHQQSNAQRKPPSSPTRRPFSPYAQSPSASNTSSFPISRRPPAPNITQPVNVHRSIPSDMEHFEAAFHAFCMGNWEVNNTEVNVSDIIDSDPEELHAYMAQKPPKRTGNHENMQKKSPGNINRLLSPPRPNGDPT